MYMASLLPGIAVACLADNIPQIPPTGAGGGNHTADFTTSAGTQEAHDNTLKAAKGIALTAIRAVIVSLPLLESRTCLIEDAG